MNRTIPARTLLLLFTNGGEDVGRSIIAEVPWDRRTWSEVPEGYLENSVLIEFPTAEAEVGTVDAIRVLDADTGIQLLPLIPLTAPKAIGDEDTFQFAVGCLLLDMMAE